MYSLGVDVGTMAIDLWPFAVLFISVLSLLVLIAFLRIHPFFSLVISATIAGLLSRPGRLPHEAPQPISIVGTPMELKRFEDGHFMIRPLDRSAGMVEADTVVTNLVLIPPSSAPGVRGLAVIDLVLEGIGRTAGQISVVIALASVIGMAMMESGAADKVVRRFLCLFGERRAGGVLAFSSYFLSIPIFFDTFFMLLMPLARSLALRTGRNYLLFLLAIATGASVTHSLLAPHPGPLAMADLLKVDIGLSIWVGLIVGLIPVTLTWQVAKWISKRLVVPVREVPGIDISQLKQLLEREERELPGLFISSTPIIVPVCLISIASFLKALVPEKAVHTSVAIKLLLFLGDRNVALLIGAALSLGLLLRCKSDSRWRAIAESMGRALEAAGIIILITAAGGSFGLMLRYAGVGETVQNLFGEGKVDLIFLAWLVAAVIRVSQGSATVSMMTSAAVVGPMITGGLPYHPVYIFMAIGFGAMIFSWMNDSGFWVVCRFSGLREEEALRSWSLIVSANSIFGLFTCLAFSRLIPGA